MEDSVRILHKHNRRFCYFQEKSYICIELFDEMQSAAVQRSYTVAKSLPTTFLISTLRCHSDRYIKVSYPPAKIITYLFVVWIASLIMLRKTIIHLYLTVFLRHEPDNRKAPIKGEKHKKHTNPYPAVKAGKHPITIYRS